MVNGTWNAPEQEGGDLCMEILGVNLKTIADFMDAAIGNYRTGKLLVLEPLTKPAIT